ncbi:MAG: DUF3299 domain-containing protein [Schleiferiaceae bacterium]|nr:DUF3299 domain-containing protein [Schleiferiaceae bacterium]
MGKFSRSFLIAAALVALPLFANESVPKHIDWNTLADVVFKEKYYAQTKEWYLFPNFSDNVKNLDGKYVRIKGYVIPLDVDNDIYALSAYPFAACFFCGGAGPESVISLKFAGKPKKYKTDQVVTFAGKLKLNDKDINEFNYILQETKEWK